MKLFYIFLLASLLTQVSCKKDWLPGIDKKALFASPTAAELDSINANWQQRDLTPQNVTIEATHPINSKLTLQFISFRLYGQKQYAGVLVPVTGTSIPVHLFIYGFNLEDPTSYRVFKTSPSDTATLPYLYVVPALRGQKLTMIINDVEYKTPVSEGTRNDAFDGATDDAIACLNAVSKIFPQADTNRVAVRGGSRGGTVALLMAARDKRVKRAVAIAFPCDLLGQTALHQNDDVYQFQFLTALLNGNKTLQQTRQNMIASSPLYFCKSLPKTQIHFGEDDTITPPQQGDLLFSAMLSAGLQDSIRFYRYANRGHSNIADNNPELENRIKTFFAQL